MRVVAICLLACGGLRAQAPLSGEAALAKFKARLEMLARERGAAVATAIPAAKTCSIPLLAVQQPAKSVDPGIVIVPKSGVNYQIRQVIPPAPPCEAGNVSLK